MRKLVFLFFILGLWSCKKKTLYDGSGIWEIKHLEQTYGPVDHPDSTHSYDDAGFFIFYNYLMDTDLDAYLGQWVVETPHQTIKNGIYWYFANDQLQIGTDVNTQVSVRSYTVEKQGDHKQTWTHIGTQNNAAYKEVLTVEEVTY